MCKAMWKKNVADFFDRCAPEWDSRIEKNDEVINRILDLAMVRDGSDVLDVACGTGIMFSYYLERNVKSVTGIDISPKMCGITEEKFGHFENVRIICGDVEEYSPEKRFDVVMVYNALPHFAKPGKLVRCLVSLLREGGRLVIAHGSSREVIDRRHRGKAEGVSVGLLPAEELAEVLSEHLEIEHVISDGCMYLVSGTAGRI